MVRVNNDRGFGMFNTTPRQNMVSKSDESLNSNVGGGKTPQYVIICKDIFGSDLGQIDGQDASGDSTPCLWVELGSARLATYDSTGEQSGDGKIVAKDIVICMKYGGWAPTIQQFLYEGKKIDSIVIKRLISINGTLVVIQEVSLETCMFKTYEQSGDTITFSFCYVIITDISKAYGHDGTSLGNVGVKFNFGTVGVEAIK
ncbi:MAG: hypothetical protein LBB21_05250 [Holosporaceae bacterium]|jgi:hypothetical protein|nr:hypothetical protein [Holosporaceae bacterium]